MISLVRKQKIENAHISVVIPVRTRIGTHLENCLRSIQNQTEKSIEVIIVHYESNFRQHNDLIKMVSEFHCSVYRYQTDKFWSLPRCVNIGLKRASGEYVVKSDADLVFEKKVMEKTLQYLQKNRSIIIRKPWFLLEEVDLEKLDIKSLHTYPRKMVSPSLGAFVAAPRGWWRKIRGYDERMEGWGSNDWDLFRRAKMDARRVMLIGPDFGYGPKTTKETPNTKIYHQWHPNVLREELGKERLKEYIEANREIYKSNKVVVKNPDEWGEGGE